LFRSGNFEGAIAEWERVLRDDVTAGNAQLRSDLLTRQGQALRALGYVERALGVLREAAVLSASDSARMAHAQTALGDALLAGGLLDEAQAQSESAVTLARKVGRRDLEAAALVNHGNVLAARQKNVEAIEAFQSAAAFAAQSGDGLLGAQALINAARVTGSAGDTDQAVTYAARAVDLVRPIPVSQQAAYVLIAAGNVFLRAQKERPQQPWVNGAVDALDAGLRIAREIGDRRSESYALGHLGELYEHEGRTADARDLTGRAIFAAERSQAPELLFRWHWQMGRLLRAQRDPDGAIAAYRRAVSELQKIRADLVSLQAAGQLSFREVLGPVYFELADLLLQQGAVAPDAVRKQALLAEARDTVERQKSAELQDYFQDSCVATLQAKITEVEKVGSNTAVVYPIVLHDRLELLVSFQDGMRQYTAAIDAATLVSAVRSFRLQLERRTTREYLPLAQQLYRWLIGPLEADLAARGTDTIVFVPDGALRTIPLAALHDGKRFLAARFALATTPGLTLTDPRALSARPDQVLLNGLTESVQGFSALPHVAAELQSLREIHGGTLLQDKTFMLANIEQEFSKKSFTLVHIASHAQFSSDPKKTFLLTYDGKLTMDNLEKMIAPSRYRNEPLEMLTLSACQTAAGDDRAALGLAGIAVKAGARSAFASLWFINDQSSTLLVTEFYRQLKEPGVSKAKALQHAQLKLIDDSRFSHPGYWAPFLLIGNWL
jgi:CHAT domain-containing protein